VQIYVLAEPKLENSPKLKKSNSLEAHTDRPFCSLALRVSAWCARDLLQFATLRCGQVDMFAYWPFSHCEAF